MSLYNAPDLFEACYTRMSSYRLNWKSSTANRFFVVILATSFAATLWHPRWWIWTSGIVFINHMVLTIAGLLPRSKLLGPNLDRLPAFAVQQSEISITIDDGPDPQVTPQVLDILDRYQAKATFFCIGSLAAKYPELCREILRRGQSIENHSQNHHTFFSLFGPTRIYREIQDAQQTLGEITGRAPQFFRPTAGLRNLFLQPVLAHLGLHLTSWTRRGYDTRNGNADAVFARLTNNLAAGDILLLHDGNAARTNSGQPVILAVLPRLLNELAARKLKTVTLSSACKST